jgi:hypothetical protein
MLVSTVIGGRSATMLPSMHQAREAAEAAAEATAGQLAAADREAALLEDQLEQVTQSLSHAQRCKGQLEAKVRQYEQVCHIPTHVTFLHTSGRSYCMSSTMLQLSGGHRTSASGWALATLFPRRFQLSLAWPPAPSPR